MAFRDKSILDLPKINDTTDFWVLGSKQGTTPGQTLSGRYPLSIIAMGFVLKGYKANEAAIKAVINPSRGDAYRALDTGHYWVFDGTQWNDVGTILMLAQEPGQSTTLAVSQKMFTDFKQSEFSSLTNKCNIWNNSQLILSSSDFINQTLDGNNNPTPSTTRILSSLQILSNATYIEVSVIPEYKLIIDFYTASGAWSSRPKEAWLYSVKWNVLGIQAFRIRIMKADGSAISPSDIDSSGLVINKISVDNIRAAAVFDDYINLAEKCLVSVTNEIIVDSTQFINATLNAAHQPSANETRLLSRYLFVGTNISLSVSVNSGYRVILDLFNNLQQWIRFNSETWMQSASLDLTGGFCYTIRVMKVDGNNISPSDIENSGLKVVLTDVPTSEPAAPYNLIFGNGDRQYVGEKVNLKPVQYNFSSSLWKSFPQADTYYLGSSLAIYNNKVFCIEENGKGTILEYTTRNVWGTLTYGQLPNHANNANFSDTFFDISDTFPLLYLSRCQAGTDMECFVYRFLNDGTGVWNGNLIQTITTDVNPGGYDLSWTIDNDNKILYAYTYLYGNWSQPNNNRCIFYGWKLPDISEDILLLKEDALLSFEIPFNILQGACVHNGLIFLNAHGGGYDIKPSQGIWVIDPRLGRIISNIPPQPKESEGIAIYNGMLYWQGRISNTTTNKPQDIYEYVF